MSVDDRRIITTLKYSKYRVKPTIVSGDPVENSKVPYIVSIKVVSRKVESDKWLWVNLCGGSIIGDYRVLSAAHCFEANDFLFVHRPDYLRVVAGSVDTEIVHSGRTETTEEVQWRKIKRIVVNKDFLFPSNDIALVYVDQKWIYSPFVSSIDLAARAADYPNTCFSAGYGKVSDNMVERYSPQLILARIRVLPRWQCSVVWQMDMNNFICTDSTFGDVAIGDSGGPLACHGITNTRQERKEVLVGVVSGKNYDKTTLYTRVSAYHDWILRDRSSGMIKPDALIITLVLLIYLLFLFRYVPTMLGEA
ncbi:unnamed protein product [Chilo suppressalis]|uniref:Peptidase S1 domain-containing protein n=1 Tax=Chilo suppressalis TaxID=168631 RepID=A0ABN8B0B5_CHISP|nr:unnamed protein product [Chilo suppressalis]